MLNRIQNGMLIGRLQSRCVVSHLLWVQMGDTSAIWDSTRIEMDFKPPAMQYFSSFIS